MTVTYRRELHLECDNPDSHREVGCYRELMLDQMDARDKRGMKKVARQTGWIIELNRCLCPHCKNKLSITDIE